MNHLNNYYLSLCVPTGYSHMEPLIAPSLLDELGDANKWLGCLDDEHPTQEILSSILDISDGLVVNYTLILVLPWLCHYNNIILCILQALTCLDNSGEDYCTALQWYRGNYNNIIGDTIIIFGIIY